MWSVALNAVCRPSFDNLPIEGLGFKFQGSGFRVRDLGFNVIRQILKLNPDH